MARKKKAKKVQEGVEMDMTPMVLQRLAFLMEIYV